MPRYEAIVITKVAEKPQLVQTLRRAIVSIIDSGGIFQTMENLGQRELPYRMKQKAEHGRVSEGNYFVFYFATPITKLAAIDSVLKRNSELLKTTIFRRDVELERPCERGPCIWGEMTNEKYRLLHLKTGDYDTIQKSVP